MNTPEPFEATDSANTHESAIREPLRESAAPHASDTLEESEVSYRYLFETNPNPMWIYDIDTLQFLLVNEAAIKHYGYSQDEFLAMTLRDIRPAEDVPLLLKSVKMQVQNPARHTLWRHRKKNGEIRHVDVTAHDFRFQGKTARLVLINDITEHRRIERALQQSEQEQRQLAEHLEKERERLAEAQAIAKVGSWDLNLTTNMLFWSEETYRIFGMDPFTFDPSYETFLARVHPEDRAAVDSAYKASVANRTLYAIDHRMIMEDGSIKIVHERCKTEYDASGHPIRSIGTVQDITEQRQAEETLHHIMEGANCLLWQADVEDVGEEQLHWTVRFASQQAAQRFLPLQVTQDLRYSDAWYMSRPLEDQQRTDLFAAQEIRAGRNYQQEFRCYSKEGVLYWLSENVRVEVVGECKWRCVGVCTDITQHKLAEEATRALTRSARCFLWYAFVEEQPEGLQWTIETLDEEAAQRFLPVAQPPGMTYQEASALARLPEDNPIMDARAAEALRSGKSGYTNQFRCLRADGEWRWVNEAVHIEALKPGHWRCVGVCTDVTEQKRAEEKGLILVNDITEHRRIERALQQSEQEQRQLAEHLEKERERLAEAQAIAKVGSWDLNLTTNVLFWSEETCRIFGVDLFAFEPSRAAFTERVHPDDRAAVQQAYIESAANRTLFTIDHRMIMPDGSIKIVHERGKTEYDASGQPIRFIGTVQDITAQKETERKLTRSLDLLRAVTEGTTDAIFAKDAQGRYLMINSAGARLVGKTPEEILGKDDTYLFAPESAAKTMEIDRQVMETGETCERENESVAGGVTRTYQFTRGPLRDDTGNIIGVVGISRDITEKRQAEQTLQHIMEGAHCILYQAEVEDGGAELLRWKIRFASEEASQRLLPLHLSDGQSYSEAWYLARPVEDRERTDRYAGQQIRAGRSFQQEFRCRDKEGALHWLLENVRVETLSEGKWRCTGVCTDITERKLAEEERSHSATANIPSTENGRTSA